MIAFALFRVFVSLVNANEEFKKLPTKEHFNKAYPNAKSIPECPTDDRGYKHIEEELSSYSSNNYFACNKKFRDPIIINQGLLLIYNCNFSDTRGSSFSDGIIKIIATGESLTESIEIHNCYFYKTQCGAIHIEAKEANIVDCSFQKCDTTSYTIASAIYLKISTGTIKNSLFLNNNGRENGIPDIKYENYDNGKLTFEGNKFKRNGGGANDNSNIITFDSNSLFDFINNFVSISEQAAGVKLFDWPQELTDISNYKFEGNTMYPSNNGAVSVTNNLLNDKFKVKSDFECFPDTIGDSQVKQFCGSPYNNLQSPIVDVTTSLVNIIYCTFYSIMNYETENGGAVYIHIDKNMQTYNEPIRIYNSDFVFCAAKNGCAIYIESYHDSLLFDFRDCHFGENFDSRLMKGGAIYIATKYSPFEFNRCSFNENIAGDGGAIYFISDTSDSQETSDSHQYILHLIDCTFHHNEAHSNGGGICIIMIGREHKKPILIEGCIFYQCQANNYDSGNEEPENGGGIYYSASYTSLVESESEHDLYINNCCFLNCMASFRGGGIFISVQKEEPSRCIEIYDCTFSRNCIDTSRSSCYSGECYSGSDLFFEFRSSSSSTPFSNTNLLYVHKCYSFLAYRAGIIPGSMSIYVTDKEPSKPIEINECTFLRSASEKGGAIRYNFTATSNSASTTSGEKSNALLVVNCFFQSNTATINGGAIAIEIANIEPSNPIEIRGCNFDLNKANETDVDIECGGSICYIQKASSYSTNYGFSVFDCIFTGNKASYYGGAIYIELEKAGESNHIEINNCSFTNNAALYPEKGIGASIYYHIHKQASQSLSASLLDDVVTFAVRNCNFTGGVATNTGEVYVEIDPDEPTRKVEFTKCIFKDSEPEALKFNSHSAFIHLNDCDFTTTSTVYFGNDIASAKVESCRFNGMTKRPITYISESPSFSDNHEFRVEKCEFKQDANVDCLFYFATQLSSNFYFHDNNIVINNEVTRALGSKEAMKETGWHFSKNAIKPGKDDFIKTETAGLIQASCDIGFICGCSQYSRCEFDSSNNEGDDEAASTIGINDYHYNKIQHEVDGAAIHVKNVAFQCDQSTFTDCHAEGQHGGGAIYIYLDKAVDYSVKLENLKFTNCEAFYGGAIFVYSDQIDNEVSITQCRFEQNMAQKEATSEGEVYFGGGAVFMVAANGNILHCKFIGNAGPAVKLYNSFEKLKESQKSLKDDSSSSSLSIEDCIFEPGDNYKSSIFYLRGSKEETKVEVKNCIFKGKMADGSYHIDGDSLSKKESPMNLHIKSCKFTGAKINNDKLIFGSFENNQIQKINTKSSSHGKLGLISLVLAGVSCFAIVLAFFAYFVTKKSQQSSSEDSNSEL